MIEKFKTMKKDNRKFSITIDEWSSSRNRRYINISVHYGEEDFENLGLVRIQGSFPAEKVRLLVEQLLLLFELNF